MENLFINQPDSFLKGQCLMFVHFSHKKEAETLILDYSGIKILKI